MTTHDLRQMGDPVIHRSITPTGPVRFRYVAVCGHTVTAQSSHPREWTGRDGVTLTECPTCFPRHELVTPTERKGTVMTSTAREARMNADPVIHRTTSPTGTYRGTTLCGQTLYEEVGYSPREWRGRGTTVLTECPTCFKAEGVEIHPLDADKMREHPTFTLHSKPGERRGDRAVFGCQSWVVSDLIDAGATVTLTRDTVAVTIEASADGGTVRVFDRSLSRAEVNEWTTSITADPTPPDPDAEVALAIADAIRGPELVRRRERAREILTDLRAAGFDVVKAPVTNS